MVNLKKQKKSGRTSTSWIRAFALVLTLGSVAMPAFSFAQTAAPTTSVSVEPSIESVLVPAAKTVAISQPETAPVDAPVDEAPAPATGLSNLSSEIMNILVPVFVTFIGLLSIFLMNWVRLKFKLNVSDYQIEAWSKLAEKGAGRGGEWARNKVKTLTKGKKVPGPEVLDVAVNWAVEMGKTMKLPELGREKLEGLIESHLFKDRSSDG